MLKEKKNKGKGGPGGGGSRETAHLTASRKCPGHLLGWLAVCLSVPSIIGDKKEPLAHSRRIGPRAQDC